MGSDEESVFEQRRRRDSEVRGRALAAVRTEKAKGAKDDRLTAGHSERGRRARSASERRLGKAKRPEDLSVSPKRVEAWRAKRLERTKRELSEEEARDELWVRERAWRLGILLRTGAYNSNRFKELPETVPVTMKRWQEPKGDEKKKARDEEFEIPKSTLKQWLKDLEPHEQQRLYSIGRRKLEFRFDENNYPKWQEKDGDTPEVKTRKKLKMEGRQRFDKEQKELADALEIVAIPMLKGAFAALGHKNVDVYLSGLPDDLAGGIDTIVEFNDEAGNLKRYADDSPMVLVIDVTYARMKDKISAEMKKRRMSEDARSVLLGKSDKIDPTLSTARATKLFRSAVETFGTMSTQTFDKHGPLPLEKYREHVPRLIIGLDYDNAFSAIINWVAKNDDEFEAFFRGTGLARRIATSVRRQLEGLYALAAADNQNPNTPYLAELLYEVGGPDPLQYLEIDRSLDNLDNLLMTRERYEKGRAHSKSPKELTWWKKAWRLRQRFVEAVRTQVAYDKIHGSRQRGDRALTESPSNSQEALAAKEKAYERWSGPRDSLQKGLRFIEDERKRKESVKRKKKHEPRMGDPLRRQVIGGGGATKAVASEEFDSGKERYASTAEKEVRFTPVTALSTQPDLQRDDVEVSPRRSGSQGQAEVEGIKARLRNLEILRELRRRITEAEKGKK